MTPCVITLATRRVAALPGLGHFVSRRPVSAFFSQGVMLRISVVGLVRGTSCRRGDRGRPSARAPLCPWPVPPTNTSAKRSGGRRGWRRVGVFCAEIRTAGGPRPRALQRRPAR
eukprot:459928-Prymnesium_polylepis.1